MYNRKYRHAEYKFRPVETLKQILVESTELTPDRVAYYDKDKNKEYQAIKYKQVRHEMDALGTKMYQMGLKGKKIAVIGDTSYHWILTYFATVAGVGVIVPLDKNLTAPEIEGLMERAKCEALFFGSKVIKKVEGLIANPGTVKYFVDMDAEEDAEGILSMNKLIESGADLVARGDREFIEAEVKPDDFCTLLFTSGTTGNSKGVMLSQNNIASNVVEMSKFFEIPKGGVVYSILPIHHVYEMTCDIWTTFYQCETIGICSSLKKLMQDMNELRATVMLGVPLVFEKVYKGIWKQAEKTGQADKLRKGLKLSKKLRLYKHPDLCRKLFKSVHDSFGGRMQKLVVGGAAADPKIIEDFELMGFSMLQGYGMTECSPILALNPDRCSKANSVGVALPGAELKILNPDENGVGEIAVKSASVMMGYYENEEATKDAFIGDGWMKTGDLGYCDSDGYYYITGRSKTVIVTKGGKNVFPEEIEDLIMTDALVQEVVVHGVEAESNGTILITADILPNFDLLTEQKGEMTDEEMHDFFDARVEAINKQIPGYKQVKKVVIRKEPFEKTTTGKIKRIKY